MTKCNPKALGLAMGILWGAALCLTTITSVLWGYGASWVNLMGAVYPWVTVSWAGAFFILIWAFIDGFVAGYVLAWLYNKFN